MSNQNILETISLKIFFFIVVESGTQSVRKLVMILQKLRFMLSNLSWDKCWSALDRLSILFFQSDFFKVYLICLTN